MIFDEIWHAGFKNWFRTRPPIVRLPFKIGTFTLKTDGVVEATQDELRYRLTPHLPPLKRGGAEGLDASHARPPYPIVVLIGPTDDRCLIVMQVPDKVREKRYEGRFDDDWEVLLVADIEGLSRRVITLEVGLHDNRGGIILTPDPVDTAADEERSWAISRSIGAEPLFLESHHLKQDLAAQVICAFSLMNARNVSLEEIHPPQSRAARRRGELPPFSYHVLKLKTFAQLREESQGRPTGETLPLHWVRGHFKTFTEAKPLFGRFSGRFWWQPHIAGTDRTRFVQKDYEVVA